MGLTSKIVNLYSNLKNSGPKRLSAIRGSMRQSRKTTLLKYKPWFAVQEPLQQIQLLKWKQ